MALVRWQPIREAESLRSEVDRIFDSFFGHGNGHADVAARARRFVPAMDLVERENELVLEADLPGLERDDVAIEVQDRVLTVSGEREASEESSKDGFSRIERSYGKFSRSLTLPEGTDSDRISADFDKGVLKVRIPKPEAKEARRIEIGAGEVEGTATEKP